MDIEEIPNYCRGRDGSDIALGIGLLCVLLPEVPKCVLMGITMTMYSPPI